MEILSKEFQEEVAQKLKVTDVQQSIYDNLSTQHYYYQLYINCKKDMIRLEEIKDRVYQELLHYYKFEYDYELKNQKDFDAYILNNEKYKTVNRTYQLKKLELEVLEETVNLFRNRSFTINNILKFMELEKR